MITNNNAHLGEGTLIGDILKRLRLMIKDGSVTTEKVANNAITTGKIASNSVTPDKLNSEVYERLGNKITITVGDYATLTITFDESTGIFYLESSRGEVSGETDSEGNVNIVI